MTQNVNCYNDAIRIAVAERIFSKHSKKHWPTLGDFKAAILQLGLRYESPMSIKVSAKDSR
jgi:hypothetical protein